MTECEDDNLVREDCPFIENDVKSSIAKVTLRNGYEDLTSDLKLNTELSDDSEVGTSSCKLSLMRFVTALATIGGFLFGYDLGLVSGALEFIEDDLNLTELQDEIIVMATKVRLPLQ